MLKFITILSLSVFWIPSFDARPGMGNSYRSSNSSSSRSSYSSYKPSYNSSSSSSKSNHTNNSYTSSSGPEPTSYFESSNHKISIHFHADGSADVNESFRIKKDQSKIGIKRPSFLIKKDAEITNLEVFPETVYPSHNSGIITIFWQNNEQNPEMDISIHYQIKDATISMGNLSLINWKFAKTNLSSQPIQFDLKWDPNSFSKNLKIQNEVFNESLLEYERFEIPVRFEEFHIQNESWKNLELNTFYVIDIPQLSERKSEPQKEIQTPNSQKIDYTLEETVTLNENGSHHYQSRILIPKDNLNQNSLQLQLGLHRFREYGESFWNHFWTPAFQISYGFKGISTYFWHLFSVSISEGITFANNLTQYDFSFSTLGETSNRQNKGLEHWIRITNLENRENLELKSFHLRLLSETKLDRNTSQIEMIVSDCEYCSDVFDQSSWIVPIEPKWESDGFSFDWNHPIPNQYKVYIRLQETNKQFNYNPILIFYAVLNAFLHSPGSGNHMGHLVLLGIFFLGFITFGFLYLNRRKSQREKKQNEKFHLLQIQKIDPYFDMELFKKKVILITEKTVFAWDKGDIESVRNFLSASVFQRFSIQLQLMNMIDGEINRMKGFSVVSLGIIGMSMESEYLTLHLKIKCKTKDKTFPKQTSELEIQNQLNNETYSFYEEIHSYTRKITTQTKPNIDLIHNLCPSCGATAKFSHATNKCEYCGGIYNSGEADWVLTEITQLVEWDELKSKNGMELQNGFAKQLLEDRASAVFWKYIHYQSFPNSEFLKRDSLDESYKQLAGPGKSPIHSPVIGSCHLVHLDLKSKPQKMTCEIRWSGSRKKGLIPEHRRSRLHLVLLTERTKTLGFSEESCHHCGAPLPEIDSSVCSYCKETIPEKVNDWLFDSAELISL
ncbi:transport protein [Leptospira levettii]|uniref:transport protein n=1 Tax=Leptospira levettii TaxID=2023178 RepID=UPI0010836C87|nr:transport protein [Leptospira levettii]TGL16344.1 transport protein [Leptospira levettii]